jgi:hypothetical protein
MPGTFDCPSCGKKLTVPERPIGNRMMCTKCGEIIPIPKALLRGGEEAGPDDVPAYKHEETPASLRGFWADLSAGVRQPKGLGIGALIFALAGILILCIPYAGYYGSLSLGGVGLAAGLIGLCLSLLRKKKDVNYPLAGVGACILTIILAILGDQK